MWWLWFLPLDILLAAVVFVFLFFVTCQRILIYPSNMPPGSRKDVPTPDAYGMVYEDVTLVTPDSIRIKMYVIRQPQEAAKRPTIMMFHANAGNVGHRMPIAQVFFTQMGYNIVALSYRGYGHSEGAASEKGIRIDAQTALNYVLRDDDLKNTPIFLYGQSLGGAVAIDLASNNPGVMTGVIAENTFTSLDELVPKVLPFIRPFTCLLTQKWASDSAIQRFSDKGPSVLFLAGARDELVPRSQMQRLYDLCPAPKEFHVFPKGTHNDTCMAPDYFAVISRFIKQTLGDTELLDVDMVDLRLKQAGASFQKDYSLTNLQGVNAVERIEDDLRRRFKESQNLHDFINR